MWDSLSHSDADLTVQHVWSLIETQWLRVVYVSLSRDKAQKEIMFIRSRPWTGIGGALLFLTLDGAFQPTMICDSYALLVHSMVTVGSDEWVNIKFIYLRLWYQITVCVIEVFPNTLRACVFLLRFWRGINRPPRFRSYSVMLCFEQDKYDCTEFFSKNTMNAIALVGALAGNNRIPF